MARAGAGTRCNLSHCGWYSATGLQLAPADPLAWRTRVRELRVTVQPAGLKGLGVFAVQEHGQSVSLAVPQLGPYPSRGAPGGSGRLVTPRERPHHWPSSHCLGCSSKPPPKPPISPPLTIQAQTAGPGRWVCSYAGELLNLSQLLTRYAASKPTYVYRLSGSLSTGCSKLAPGADLIPRFPCAEGTCRGYLRRPRCSPWPPVNTRGMFRLAPSPATLLSCCTQALDRRTGHRSLLSLPQPPRAPQPARKGRPHQN